MINEKETQQGLSCPLCGHVSNNILYSVSAQSAAEHMFRYEGSQEEINHLSEIIVRLWRSDKADMLRCRNCQLVFANPFLAGSIEFYSAVYRKASYYPGWKWDYELTSRDLHGYLDQNREKPSGKDIRNPRILEVGAGNGAFVKKLAEGLFRKEDILCTEYSDYGNEQILKLGIRSISGPVQALATNGNVGLFDYICMFQVLEHLDDLNDQFRILNQLSRKGTILYITVPSEEYRTFYDRLGRHMDTPPNHLTRWNCHSFRKLGEKFGWNLTEHHNQSMPYQEKVKRLIFDRLEYHGIFKPSKWAGKSMPLYRKAMLALAAGSMVLTHPLAVIRLRDKELGISQWVKFTRE